MYDLIRRARAGENNPWMPGGLSSVQSSAISWRLRSSLLREQLILRRAIHIWRSRRPFAGNRCSLFVRSRSTRWLQ